jgi:hypothetical protein
LVAFTDRYFLPLTTIRSASFDFFGVAPVAGYRVIVEDRTLQRSAGDTFWCFVALASNVVGVTSEAAGVASLAGLPEDADCACFRGVGNSSFVFSANIMDVSQDDGADIVKVGVAKRGTWRTASRRSGRVTLTIEYDTFCLVCESVPNILRLV